MNPTASDVYVVVRKYGTGTSELLAAFTQEARAIGYAKYREKNKCDRRHIY